MSVPLEVERVARELNMPLDGLMQRSLQAFLRQEVRAVQMDISDLQDRYKVAAAGELRAQIEQRKVHSHPAWEDAIEWEKLESHLKRLESMLNKS
jgi:anti-sigma-K factor RskA